MIKARLFSIVMAVTMLMAIVVPFSATTVAAMPLDPPPHRYEPAIAPPDDKAYSPTSPNYSCSLINQSPKDWVTLSPRQSFDATWTVQNTGAVWYTNNVQFAYIWGAKMQTHGDIFGITNDVGKGGKLHLAVDMIAPKSPGTYPITWGVYTGRTRVCLVTLVVTVVR